MFNARKLVQFVFRMPIRASALLMLAREIWENGSYWVKQKRWSNVRKVGQRQ